MKLKYSYIDGGVHPILGQVFHWRQETLGNGDAARYQRYICDVLGAVAQTLDDCDRLLNFIEEIESGKEDQVETGGNDVTLTFRRTGVQVDINVNDDWIGQPEGVFSLQEWRVALEGWQHFLKMPQSLETVVEIDL